MAVVLNKDNVLRMKFMTGMHNTDPFFVAREEYLFQMMQEATNIHAHLRQSDLPALQREGHTWVIARAQMKIDAYNLWTQDVHVNTWAQEPELFYFPRVTTASASCGKPLFTAVCWWVVLDLATSRPIQPSDMIARFGLPPHDETHPRFPARYKRFRANTTPEIIPLHTCTPVPRYEDTDSNNHINNVSYVQWMLDSLHREFRDTYKAVDMDVFWLQQVYLGDRLTMCSGPAREAAQNPDVPHYYHYLTRTEADGNKSLVWAAESQWNRRTNLIHETDSKRLGWNE
ncbi:acyl-ACP thioesterase domain-containing protein [Parasphaerochaeta coccoides]|uniref:Acyl-ACP thioesterase n=1 Tax=Parasphaerochaeta coccoides (strain ATCC BAA-1237 / DSM 17374 / SPN1) TaxID=760011 RepID=F4GJR0_PARC1|nr:acyl-ACP thioesterase domain-containing protein [Parasphaerochaeta coccoides]AEC02807.1 acyl-ACP thioesterase [Parasphaerochaeta coccoides DSM 17374]